MLLLLATISPKADRRLYKQIVKAQKNKLINQHMIQTVFYGATAKIAIPWKAE
jgi:hypothetical protein